MPVHFMRLFGRSLCNTTKTETFKKFSKDPKLVDCKLCLALLGGERKAVKTRNTRISR